MPSAKKTEILEFHFCDFEHSELDLVKCGIRMYYELKVVDKFHIPREVSVASVDRRQRRLPHKNRGQGCNSGTKRAGSHKKN